MFENPAPKQPNNPLHGVRLDAMLERLVEVHGWARLGEKTNIVAFLNNPTFPSSLKFLRKTPWARKKVEVLYLRLLQLETLGKKL
jgi:uncharacterized protein (DUF2132 family)